MFILYIFMYNVTYVKWSSLPFTHSSSSSSSFKSMYLFEFYIIRIYDHKVMLYISCEVMIQTMWMIRTSGIDKIKPFLGFL